MIDINKIYKGTCLDVLKTFPDNSIDSCVTDPPYFLMSGSGSGGFMNKEWDGVANFEERILWKSKEFAQYVARFFSLMRIESSMEGGKSVQETASMSKEGSNPKKKPVLVQPAEINSNEVKAKSYQNANFVQGLVLTKAEVLGLLKEVFQDLITVSESNNENVLYAIPFSLTEIKSKNAAPQDVVKFLTAKAQEGQTTMLSLMDEARISGAIEGMIGIRLESKSMQEMDGIANDAVSIVEGRKYSAITLNATERLKTMHWITSLLFATFVTQEWKENQNNFLVYLFHKNWLREVYRVLKPGAFLLSFAGCRTYHLLASAVEDVGFEIRDQIDWNFGSGFPKSLDIGKAIDKLQGNERIVMPNPLAKKQTQAKDGIYGDYEATTTISKGNSEWEGWGTALKPAHEPICMARKPIECKTVAENVLKYGTGGINIDGSRIAHNEEQKFANRKERSAGWNMDNCGFDSENNSTASANEKGRFPANVIFDEFMGEELDKQTGNLKSGTGAIRSEVTTIEQKFKGINPQGLEICYGDEGGASRFFYCPKADNYERNKGLKRFDGKQTNDGREKDIDNAFQRGTSVRQNHHPTVKPIDLMRYLVKLITPKRGICLDPYCGSGTTLIGCKLELINYIGIEREEEYCKIAEARVVAWNPERFIEQKLF